jgi:hypothetical protein
MAGSTEILSLGFFLLLVNLKLDFFDGQQSTVDSCLRPARKKKKCTTTIE